MKKTYVIGDIHGCHKALVELLAKISPDPHDDTIIFLGDYIDRGPDSKQVVSELLRLRVQFRNVITLMGNHEQMFLNYLSGNDREYYLMIGGRSTLVSYGIIEPDQDNMFHRIPDEHLRFFKELLIYWEDRDYIYVHAGLQPGVHLSQQSIDWLLWSREKFINSDYVFDKRVVFGHTPFRTPSIEKNKIGIDTGAVYGGSLTCLILPFLEFVSVGTEGRKC